MIPTSDASAPAPETLPRSPAASCWQPSPYVLLRFAGLPYRELDRLALERTAAAVDAVLDLEESLAARRPALSEALFVEIGRREGRERGWLVALRRALHNLRPPEGPAAGATRLLENPPLRNAVEGFLADTEELRQRLVDGARLLESERLSRSELLRISLADPELQKALQVASPPLAVNLRRLVSSEPREWRARERRTAAGAFRYLARAAAKTSPFGRLGPVALGRFDPQHGSTLVFGGGPLRLRATTDVNRRVVSRIALALGKHPEVSAGLRLTVNQALRLEDDQVIFLRLRSPGKAGGTAFRRVARTPLLELILATLAERELRLDEAVAEVCRRGGYEEARVERLLRELVRSELVRYDLKLAADSPAPLGELRRRLGELAPERAGDWERDLAFLEEQAASFSTSGPSERFQLLREASRIATRLSGTPEDPDDPESWSELFFEDVAFEGTGAKLGGAFLRSVEEEIGLLLDCLHARDRGLGLDQLLLLDVFTAAYGPGGRCSDLVDLAVRYARGLAGYVRTRGAPGGSGNFSRAEAFGRRLARFVCSLGGESEATQGEREVRLDPEAVRELIRSFGGVPAEHLSLSLHLQVAAVESEAIERGEFLLVLNHALPGFGRYFTRYGQVAGEPNGSALLSALREAAGRLAAAGTGAEPVEVMSVLDHNAQAHPLITERQIVTPQEVSRLPEERQIPVSRLEIRHDVERDRLELYEIAAGGGGRRLLPLCMGFLHNLSLPPLHHLLACLSPAGYFPGERLRPAQVRESAGAWFAAVGEMPVRRYPRLRLGRLVLQRETWVFPPHALPSADQADPFLCLLEVARWARRHGLPRRVFARLRSRRQPEGTSKPVPVDFHCLWSVEELLQTIKEGDLLTLEIEEMLPAPDHLLSGPGGEARAVELQIELNREV